MLAVIKEAKSREQGVTVCAAQHCLPPAFMGLVTLTLFHPTRDAREGAGSTQSITAALQWCWLCATDSVGILQYQMQSILVP